MTDGAKPAAHRHDAAQPGALSPELAALAEALAAHVHDAWMRVRLREGWSYAPQRDDTRKTHPCLVPFEQLPEADKDCDREVTRATLLAMQALGFDVVKRG